MTDQQKDNPKQYIVGVGASAGGLDVDSDEHAKTNNVSATHTTTVRSLSCMTKAHPPSVPCRLKSIRDRFLPVRPVVFCQMHSAKDTPHVDFESRSVSLYAHFLAVQTLVS